jgi:hypothetical protein
LEVAVAKPNDYTTELNDLEDPSEDLDVEDLDEEDLDDEALQADLSAGLDEGLEAGLGEDLVGEDLVSEDLVGEDLVSEDIVGEDLVGEELEEEEPLDEEEDESAELDEEEEDEEEALDILLARDTGLNEDLVRLDDETRDGLGDVDAPIRAGEFTCRSCFLVKRRPQLADAERMICLDCV